MDCALLTTEEMYQADGLAAEAGVTGLSLMESAGRGAAEHILQRFLQVRRILVLCGPGNNGGDGFVVARHMRAYGFDVTAALLGRRDALTGDAATMGASWDGPVLALTSVNPEGFDLIVDAVFGAGLTRPVEGSLATLFARINNSGIPVVAVDIPSGIDGNSGAVRGTALNAAMTVTFFRMKPGHLLYPGRSHCGELFLVNIGIPDNVLEKIKSRTFENTPEFWSGPFPRPGWRDHKYSRGAVLAVSGGPWTTGAIRLAAAGALRVGAGVVTIAAPKNALPIHAAHLTAIMLRQADKTEDLESILLDDDRMRAVIIGPALGTGNSARVKTEAMLAAGPAVVLDADALTAFADKPQALFDRIAENPERRVVMTPHEGEFARLFPDLHSTSTSRLERARSAAARARCVILLKGADTVVAAPDGRAVISANAPSCLATAGAGDVLAGFVGGLLAQGMPALEAAAAGAWIHGEAAGIVGPGLIAEDLPDRVPPILNMLTKR